MDITDGKIQEISTSRFYHDCYIIFLDKAGTKVNIRDHDTIYNNRIGFYEIVSLYKESVDVFDEILEKRYQFFGFSDTIVVMIPNDEAGSDLEVRN